MVDSGGILLKREATTRAALSLYLAGVSDSQSVVKKLVKKTVSRQRFWFPWGSALPRAPPG